jgi:hypothetical protein
MPNNEQHTSKGVSLAKGPVGILGLIGLIYGISALILGGHGFALHIPHGAVHGKKWLGLEVNGWTDLLFIAAGLLLLFSAPLHWGAKSMSLLVGFVLLAAAIIAVIRGNGVFGIFAANHLTELVWAAAGVLLLLLALLPRVGRKDKETQPDTGAYATTERPLPPRRSDRATGSDTTPQPAPVRSRLGRRRARPQPGPADQDRPASSGAQSTNNLESR